MKATRGIRNNNPLNIIISRSNWLGKITDQGKKKDKTFEEFISMTYGLRAAIKLLQRYIRDGYNTVGKIIPRWCPDHTAKSYEQTVVKSMKQSIPDFNSSKKILGNDADTLYQLVKAMAWVESLYVVTQAEFERAYALV